MDPKDLEFEETLADSELLLKNTARSMDADAEFTLASIKAEYGSSTPAAPISSSNRLTGIETKAPTVWLYA